MDMNVLNIVFMFGGLQAILLTIGININKPFDSNKKKMTTLMLMMALVAMIYYIMVVSKWQVQNQFVWTLGNIAWMGLVPSFYYFVRSVTDERFQISKKIIFSFLIPILFLFDGLVVTFCPGCVLYAFVGDENLYFDIWMLLFCLSGFYFIYLSWRHLQSVSEHLLARSLMKFTISIGVLIITYLIAFIIKRGNYSLGFELVIITLFEILIFAMVIRAFRLAPIKSFFAEPKYQNTLISTNSDLSKIKSQIDDALIEQKLFLNPKLTLAELSKSSGVLVNRLSEFFNSILDSSFYEYVNDLRLDHVEALIQSGEYRNYTITALAQESGFNSKTTFYKVFKMRHDMTPTEYIRKLS